MIKSLITPVNIAFFFWGLILVALSQVYPEYTRYYLYASILVIIPFMVVNLVKQKKEDKRNQTTTFKSSIYRMIILGSILLIFFFITRQHPI